MRAANLDRRHSLFVLTLTLSVAGTSCTPQQEVGGDLEISDVYISEPVMGERAAMYFTVTNRGGVADHLIAVSTPVAALAEIHRTVADGGMMHMEPVESLRVMPGQALHFAPGGYHVMLLDLARQIASGDEVEATLTFRRAGPVAIRARVISLPRLEGVLDSTAGHGMHD